MAQSIWKFPLELTDTILIKMPEGSEILTIQMQYEQPCMWALVDINAAKKDRVFRIIGTGHPIESNPGKYIGTFQLREGRLVFHLFELFEK